MAADGRHRGRRLPSLGQRNGRGRNIQRLFRPPQRLSRRRARRSGPARGGVGRLVGACAAHRPESLSAGPRAFRARPRGAAAHLSGRRGICRVPDPALARAVRRDRLQRDPAAQPHAERAFHESVPPILHEDDLNAMYWSIENRSPFLDRKLSETAQRVPARHLVRNGRAKALLREAVRGIAPDAIIDNPRKVGFNAPIQDLLDTTDSEVRHWLFDDGPIFEHVRKDRIRSLLERGTLPNSRSKFLFYFLNAKLFLEEFGG
ncbi:asparagine synthase-related protein [Azospirillum brasilense]|uniref:asparagine synthase-related protein n=1 Tax=Azospirillum brasilense TaxID=192 RepID=UPI001FFFBF59|nr:asparagine synthase-related protein [Azospirillum brasilense]